MNKFELKVSRYPGKIIKRFINGSHYYYYLDQLDWYEGIPYPDNPDKLLDTDGWVSSRVFEKYLYEWYGIDSQEYYNLVIYGDITKTPICPFCNVNLLEWKGSISGGYRTNCGNIECSSKSRGLGIKKWINSLSKEELFKHQSLASHNRWDSLTNEEYESESKRLTLIINSHEAKCNSAYTNLLNKGDLNDKMYFYIAVSHDNKFKYGVSQDIEKRQYWDRPYKNWKIIVEDTRYRLAELEYFIKINLPESSEYLTWDLVPKFIELFGKYYNDIIIQKLHEYK